MAKKPIIITIHKGRHKAQPYSFDIDMPGSGPKVTKKERYAQRWNAKRAALKQAGAVTDYDTGAFLQPYRTLAGRLIEFTNKKK